ELVVTDRGVDIAEIGVRPDERHRGGDEQDDTACGLGTQVTSELGNGPGCAARPCRHENSLSRGDITPTRLPGTPLPILTAEAAPSAHCDTEHDSYVVRHEHGQHTDADVACYRPPCSGAAQPGADVAGQRQADDHRGTARPHPQRD